MIHLLTKCSCARADASTRTDASNPSRRPGLRNHPALAFLECIRINKIFRREIGRMQDRSATYKYFLCAKRTDFVRPRELIRFAQATSAPATMSFLGLAGSMLVRRPRSISLIAIARRILFPDHILQNHGANRPHIPLSQKRTWAQSRQRDKGGRDEVKSTKHHDYSPFAWLERLSSLAMHRSWIEYKKTLRHSSKVHNSETFHNSRLHSNSYVEPSIPQHYPHPSDERFSQE